MSYTDEHMEQEIKEPSDSEEGSKSCSGSVVSYNSTFTDPNLIRELRECIRDPRIKSSGLFDLAVARLAKELGGSTDDIKVKPNMQQSVNNCDTTCPKAGELGSLLPEFPWESIPTQDVLKYVGPVSFEYVWALTNEQLDYWTCTISMNQAPEPTPSITQSGITEEVAFAEAIRTLKEIAYKNEWVLG